jgi:flagellar hook assembly protein FlgD
VDNATLTVYDASGNVVSKVRVSDKALGTQDRRQVAEWNLKDSKGRLVPEGAYLVRGVVKTGDGKRERWSVVVGVR